MPSYEKNEFESFQAIEFIMSLFHRTSLELVKKIVFCICNAHFMPELQNFIEWKVPIKTKNAIPDNLAYDTNNFGKVNIRDFGCSNSHF